MLSHNNLMYQVSFLGCCICLIYLTLTAVQAHPHSPILKAHLHLLTPTKLAMLLAPACAWSAILAWSPCVRAADC